MKAYGKGICILQPYWVTILWQILLLREEVILCELKTLVCLN